ncbi:BSD domain-containing protein [Psidium guajava]|nr:BSD domain-containing protein [Psidium guajava]
MEDWWKRAKTFAEEAAKKSQTLATSATSAKISDLISETAKKSRELALEASKKADELKVAALKQADQIKSIADSIAPQESGPSGNAAPVAEEDFEKLGVTGDLREFVKGFTPATFQNFPIRDEGEEEECDVATTGSNVRQDLTEWQAKHATLVLTTVKEISRLRYQLCPRVMKERRFWRIYFTLVSTHVAPYEKRYLEDAKLKAAEQAKAEKMMQASVAEIQNPKVVDKNAESSSSTLAAQQDLDTFLLGDLEDSDGGQDDGEGSFGDDFDKIDNLDDEDEEDQQKPT